MWQAYQAGGWYGVGNVKGGRVADAALMIGSAGVGAGVVRGVGALRVFNASRKWTRGPGGKSRRQNMLDHFYRNESGVARGIRMGYKNPVHFTRGAMQNIRRGQLVVDSSTNFNAFVRIAPNTANRALVTGVTTRGKLRIRTFYRTRNIKWLRNRGFRP